MWRRLFHDHPASVGETYGEHFVVASGFSVRLLGAGLMCLVHAFLPFLFKRTASMEINRLHDRMVVNRVRRPVPPAAPHAAPTDPVTR
jgi:hypothetical protein